MIQLCTRGDDIGTFKSANKAALDAFENGILRNISLMASTPHIEDAAQRLAGIEDICFGLHMTITSEWQSVSWYPVLHPEQIPSLVDEKGRFLPNPMDIHKRGVVFKEILAEMQAQLDKLRSLGFTVAYADSHMGFDWLFEKEDSDRIGDHLEEWVKKEGLLYNKDSLASKLPKGPTDLSDPIERILKGLEAAEDGGTYLLLGHPCFNDEEMYSQILHDPQPGAVGANRDQQRRFFTDNRILSYCKEHEIIPTRFDKIN